MSCLFKKKTINYDLVNKHQLQIGNPRTTLHGLNSLTHMGATLWNRLPNNVKMLENTELFKRAISDIDIIKLENIYR